MQTTVLYCVFGNMDFLKVKVVQTTTIYQSQDINQAVKT